MYAVTGSTGQLGRLVIEALLQRVPASEIIAVARDAEKAADLSARGVKVRIADYDQPDTLAAAFAQAERILLISSSAVGKRVPQHLNAIAAAKGVGAAMIAYTSILHADTSPLGLAAEHRATEEALRSSGIDFALLRNGWYTENYLSMVIPAIEHGAVLGASGEGLVSSASRADYAAAAARVLSDPSVRSGTYELAGDAAWTKADFAAAIAHRSGRSVAYKDMPPAAFTAALETMGLPSYLVQIIVDADVGTGEGALFEDGGALRRLIGRPTTSMADSVANSVPTV